MDMFECISGYISLVPVLFGAEFWIPYFSFIAVTVIVDTGRRLLFIGSHK